MVSFWFFVLFENEGWCCENYSYNIMQVGVAEISVCDLVVGGAVKVTLWIVARPDFILANLYTCLVILTQFEDHKGVRKWRQHIVIFLHMFISNHCLFVFYVVNGVGVEGGRDCGGCPWVLRIGGVGCCGKDCEDGWLHYWAVVKVAVLHFSRASHYCGQNLGWGRGWGSLCSRHSFCLLLLHGGLFHVVLYASSFVLVGCSLMEK